MYRTVFAALTKLEFMRPLLSSKYMPGHAAIGQFRHHVVLPVAYALISLVASMLVCSVGLFLYACAYPSTLKEDPIGLLGKANVLFQSDVALFMERFYCMLSEDENLVKRATKEYSIRASGCWYERERDGDTGRVRIKNLTWMSVPNFSSRARARAARLLSLLFGP